MKWREIFRFELAYQTRRVWTWLIFAALLVFSFLMTRDGTLAEALHHDFFINSPFAIAKTTVACSLIWLLVAAAVAGEAAARDVATGMHPLTWTVPVSKGEYLGGRFLAAFFINALILLAVQGGILLAVYLPGVDAALIGPFRPAAYLTAYAFLALPNAFFGTAIQFSLATRSGRPMAGYLGSVLLFFMSYVVGIFLLSQGRKELANLLDPVGVNFILSELSHLWTTIEKNTRLVELKGTVLTNRLLWLGVGLGTIAVTYLRFRFEHRVATRWLKMFVRRSGGAAGSQPHLSQEGRRAERPPLHRGDVVRAFGFVTAARRTLAIAWDSFRAIATSWAGLALLGVIPLLSVAVVLDQMVSEGGPLVPTTARVIRELTAPLAADMSRWIIVPLLLVFIAGELLWRERDAGVGEITDAMPGSEWTPFSGKLLGLGLLLIVFMTLLITAGVLAQTIAGHQDFQIGLYLKIMFGLQLPEYLLFALLALVVHVLVDQKYIGHLVAIIAFVIIVLAPMFGIEHNLLVYGSGPGWSYTEMRGFGPSLGPWLWFQLYWAAWALLLAVLAKLLWARGEERRFAVRLQLARRRFTRPTVWTAAVAVGLIVALGGFIFYNTNVLNEYLNASGIAGRKAEYERRYGRYATLPQPLLTGTNLRVEIFPERGEVEIRGSYRLVNDSAVAIGSIQLATVPRVDTRAVTFDRPAALVLEDRDRGHRIYTLKMPLQPGDSLRLDFDVHVKPRGFRESGIDDSVSANGTSFLAGDWLPAIGYQRDRELTSAADRRKHGLAPRPLIASLDDVEARKNRGAGITFEAVVGTDANQVAVAPGALRRTWRKGTRRYFHYATDAPIGGEWTFFSAAYAVHEATWKDPSTGSGEAVAIRIFHHPQHTGHLQRMVRSIRVSLDTYSRKFGRYEYGHLTVVERAGNGVGLHADASLIFHSEGFTTWRPDDAPQALDMPFAVTAHEVAHQWTVPSAAVEGAPVMSESIAWYYAMQVVEETYGREHLQRLLHFMRQPYPYPPIRRGEPLLRGLDPYLSYRKGPFALFALSEYVGRDRVNGALRRLLEKHQPAEAPLATTLDLYRELQAVTPDSLQHLLHDLFEVNTYWEFGTERVMAEQTKAGTWQVTLDVRARKAVFDEAGAETVLPMDELVEIGIFGSAEKDHGELSAPLYLQKHRIRPGAQAITVTVRDKPVLAGIDPHHLLDWVEGEDDDNIKAVKVKR